MPSASLAPAYGRRQRRTDGWHASRGTRSTRRPSPASVRSAGRRPAGRTTSARRWSSPRPTPPTVTVNYGRGGNPTWTAFEEALGALEGGRALVFVLRYGGHRRRAVASPPRAAVVAPGHAYNGTRHAARASEAAGRLRVRRVDVSRHGRPSRPLRRGRPAVAGVAHQPAPGRHRPAGPAAAARRAGLVVVVDNTFATPLLQRPLGDRRRRRRALGDQVPLRPQRRGARRGRDAPTRAGRALHERLAHRRLCTVPSRGRWRPGSRCAGCARCRCGSSGPGQRGRAGRRASRPPGRARVRYPGFGAIVVDRGRRRRATAAERVCAADAALGARDEPRRGRVPARAPPAPARRRAAHGAGEPAAALGRHRGRRRPVGRPRPSPRRAARPR